MSEKLEKDEVRELAKVFRDRTAADQLLLYVGMDELDLPIDVRSSLMYWQAVDEILDRGALAGGRLRILTRAAELYPANILFPGRVAELRRAGQDGMFPPPGAYYEARGASVGNTGPKQAGDFGGASRESVHGTVVAMDVVGYSGRGEAVQRAVRKALPQLLWSAVRGAGIPPEQVQDQDRGDGYIVLIPSVVPVERIAADFVHELRIALREYNQEGRDAHGRIRLRVALHEGHVAPDVRGGWAGAPIVVAARLVDAAPLKKAMEAYPNADLGLIVSDEMYRSAVVEGRRGLDIRAFRAVKATVKEFQERAWLTIPELGVSFGLETEEPSPTPDASAGRRVDASGAEAGRDPGTPSRPNSAMRDFFVSAAEDDQGWGSWIAWYLTKEGYTVRLESWALLAGSRSVEVLNEALESSKRTIAVLSPAYLASKQVQTAWGNAWLDDPAGLERTLIPVRVAPCEPGGLLRGIRYIDLVGLREDAARQYLVEQIRRAVDGRYRPTTAPPFPGPS